MENDLENIKNEKNFSLISKSKEEDKKYQLISQFMLTSIIIILTVILGIFFNKKFENKKKLYLERSLKNLVYTGKIYSDSLYVKKVDNLNKDFIFGMDVSSVIAEENSGVKYFDFNDKETDLFEILDYVGINYIRIRIWNDPFDSKGNGYGGGNNDIEQAIRIGKRAAKYGMKILASFHYSDFYADYKNQQVPKAWQNFTLEEKSKSAEKFTFKCIQKFINEGIDVGIVALGNEINDFFCGETKWENIVKILNGCSRAVRELSPKTLISVHFTNPERKGSLMYFADQLNKNKLDYDAFSVSYYPVWNGNLDNLQSQLNDVANTYNKKIFIAETQYPYTRKNFDFYPDKTPGYNDVLYYPLTIQGQSSHIRNLVETVSKIKNNIGIFYWEGAWIAVGNNSYVENREKWEKYGSGWASSYSSEYDPKIYQEGGCPTENQALFNSEGKPLESLKTFNLLKFGNEINTLYDAVEDISINPINFDYFSLPKSINIIDTSGQRINKEIDWDEYFDIDRAKSDNEYNFNGKADDVDLKCSFIFRIKYERKFICYYFIGEKELSPWRENNLISIREL